MPEYKQFTLKEYAEIMMIVSSRIFSFRVDGVEMKGLVPFADMVNHQQVGNSSWFDQHQDVDQVIVVMGLSQMVSGSTGSLAKTTYLPRCISATIKFVFSSDVA